MVSPANDNLEMSLDVALALSVTQSKEFCATLNDTCSVVQKRLDTVSEAFKAFDKRLRELKKTAENQSKRHAAIAELLRQLPEGPEGLEMACEIRARFYPEHG